MPSYIVLISPSYGGAEKRFFDIFQTLKLRGENLYFVGPSSLTRSLLKDSNSSHHVVQSVISIDLAFWSRREFILKYYRLLSGIQKGSCFHYPLNCLWPLHLGRGDTVSMSVTDCQTVPRFTLLNMTALWSWASFFFVDRIDVLNSTIYSKMVGYSMARKMGMTPGGTFVAPGVLANKRRRPHAVLLSRLIRGKGIEKLLDIIEDLWSILRERVPKDFMFEIAGYGHLSDYVADRVKVISRRDVPIKFIGYIDATELFSRSAVALSMQDVTNYPSRVVAEALCQGCPVIVRNSGDSTQFGLDICGLVYCREELDMYELANLISEQIRCVIADDRYSGAIASSARKRFSSDSCLDYFGALFCNTKKAR